MELVFIDWNDFCSYKFEDYNITGYYVYGNGQTACRFEDADADVKRVPRHEIHSKFGSGFPSLTTLESPSKTLEYLVRAKTVTGTIRTSKAKTISKAKIRDMLMELGPGWKWFDECVKTNRYRTWRAYIQSQCKLIREDMKSFKGESYIDEVTSELKDHMQVTFQQLKEDSKVFEEASLRAMREIIAEYVIDN